MSHREVKRVLLTENELSAIECLRVSGNQVKRELIGRLIEASRLANRQNALILEMLDDAAFRHEWFIIRAQALVNIANGI